jgi:L-threonylcarbamoyladenylate synthase
VTSGLPSVAVRLPRHPVAQALLERCGFPLAAPSANRFGRISPTSAADVLAELGSRIDLILDGGRCEVGVESTVVRVRLDGGLELLRPGGIGRAAIEAAAGQPLVAAGGERASPGLLASHYAPRTRLWLLPGAAERELEAAARRARLPSGAPLGVLLQRGDERERAEGLGRALGRPVTARVLSPGGQPAEAARRLFGCLRELDAAAVVALFAEPCPDEEGLMHAIADRLRRAAGLG